MAKQTASSIYDELTAAGYTPAAAVVQTAIALAESGGDDAALGDVGLENATWGPSYGLFQVRTLKNATGTGTDRDVSWLSAGDANQAKAAYDISAHGTNFAPWSTYTNGAYQKFLPQAQAAAASAGDTTTAVLTGIAAPSGLSGLLDSATSNLRTGLIAGLFIVLGLGLLGAGLYRAVRPSRDGGQE